MMATQIGCPGDPPDIVLALNQGLLLLDRTPRSFCLDPLQNIFDRQHLIGLNPIEVDAMGDKVRSRLLANGVELQAIRLELNPALAYAP